MKTKIIVVTGGVYSSLGKGIVASSIGCILKHGNFKIAMLKLDPYLNTDPGLLNPLQHGEVFITEDGQKTDLDLGHYERFTGLNLTKAATQTGGKLYTEILNDEKLGKYNGATIQIIPHLTNKIMEKIDFAIKSNNNPDFLIIEIGGTAGDIESLAFMEAVRLYNVKNKNVMFVHCSPLFQLSANGEIKTKPAQHSVKTVRNLGINPNMLILRFKDLIGKHEKEKLSWTCDVPEENIFVSKDCKYLYEVPKVLFEQGIHKSILKFFGIKTSKFDMSDWNKFLSSIYAKRSKQVHVCICGKYTELNDSYLSLIESLKIACYKNGADLKLDLVSTKDLTNSSYKKVLSKYDGFIVPDGEYNKKDSDSLQWVVKYCIENKKPYFGIKLGMQVMIDYFMNESKLDTKGLYLKVNDDDQFLGLHSITLNPKSRLSSIYKNMVTEERHWNNWIVDAERLDSLTAIVPVAFSKTNEIEAIELKEKTKFFIGVLYHPEYVSKPNKPHPLFNEFIKSML